MLLYGYGYGYGYPMYYGFDKMYSLDMRHYTEKKLGEFNILQVFYYFNIRSFADFVLFHLLLFQSVNVVLYYCLYFLL